MINNILFLLLVINLLNKFGFYGFNKNFNVKKINFYNITRINQNESYLINNKILNLKMDKLSKIKFSFPEIDFILLGLFN